MPRILVFIGADESMAWKSIPSALFCFAIGAYLSNLSNSPTSQETFKILSVFSVGFLFMYLEGGYMGAWWVTILLTTSYLGYRRTQGNPKINGPISLFLGTICYGIYLIHSLVIAHVNELSETFAFYLTLPITVVIATFTWKFVERPTNNLFRKRDFLKRAPSSGNL
jgi:peptidoglycan/LPS O-acetylase OafA/YrhL